MEQAFGWIFKNVGNISGIITLCLIFVKPIREKVFGKILKDRAERAGICALLRKAIISECKTAQEQGFMYEYDSENLQDMFRQYSELGGNHGIEKLVNQANSLEVKLTKEV